MEFEMKHTTIPESSGFVLSTLAAAVLALFGSGAYAADKASELTLTTDASNFKVAAYYLNQDMDSVSKTVGNDTDRRVFLYFFNDKTARTYDKAITASLTATPADGATGNLARTLNTEFTNLTFQKDVSLSVTATNMNKDDTWQTAAVLVRSADVVFNGNTYLSSVGHTEHQGLVAGIRAMWDTQTQSEVTFAGNQTVIHAENYGYTAEGIQSEYNIMNFTGGDVLVESMSDYGSNGAVINEATIANSGTFTVKSTLTDGYGCNAVGLDVDALTVTSNVDALNIIVNGVAWKKQGAAAGTIGLRSYDNTTIDAGQLNIRLNGTELERPDDDHNYSTARGLVNYGGTLIVGENTVTTIDVKDQGDATGILSQENGTLNINGDLTVKVTVPDGSKATAAKIESGTTSLGSEGHVVDLTGDVVVSDSDQTTATLNLAGTADIKGDVEVNSTGTLNIAGQTDVSGVVTSTGAVNIDKAVLSINGDGSTLASVKATEATLALGSGKYEVTSFTGTDKTLLLNDISADVTIGNRTDDTDGMTLAASGKANDAFASSQEAVDALLETGLANKGETIEVQEGLVNDAVTGTVAVDEAGNSTLTDVTVQKNSTVDAFGSVASLTAYQWRHEMNDLTKRMGELRMSPEGVGSWARIYGSTFEYGAQNLTAKNNSVQVGVDATAGAGWTVGAAFSYTDGSTTYDRGEADNEAFALGVYGTWMHESGQFVDLIAKYGRLSNDFTLAGLEGSFESNAFSVSAEYGWHLKLSDVAFVEPQAEVSYGRIMGDDFTASRGDQSVRFSQEDTEFLITRLGVRTGFYFPKDRGTVYARASVAHDFKGEVEATAANAGSAGRNTAYADLGGTWLEWGLGANFNLTDRTFAYVDLERTTGAEADEKVRYSVGVRHVW